MLFVLDLRVRGVELVRRGREQERAHAFAVVRPRLEQLMCQICRGIPFRPAAYRATT